MKWADGGTHVMWQHYRSTFTGMQIVIAVVAASIYLLFGHNWLMALTFFVVMQLSAVIGAVWATRLRVIVERRRSRLIKPCD